MRTARLLALVAAAGMTGCGKTAPVMPADAGTDAAPDREKLQGVWKIESLESGDPRNKPSDGELENLRFVFQGDRVRTVHKDKFEDQAALALDTTQNPKVMTLTRLDGDGQPQRIATTDRSKAPEYVKSEWIYKFEGDTLVIALREGMRATRPADFKPDPGKSGRGGFTAKGGAVPYEPGVPPTIVIRLKKTDEPVPPEPKRPRFGTASGYRGATAARYGATAPYRGTGR